MKFAGVALVVNTHLETAVNRPEMLTHIGAEACYLAVRELGAASSLTNY